MNYKELKTIADENILDKQKTLPADAFQIASKLNLRVKNSIEAKKDLGEDRNLLTSNNAVYVLYKGEYTIYYDEHYRYKNFSVAHEVAHHILGHTSDGADQHKDAQLMAAIIVAPTNLIRKYNINSPAKLSEICKMPIEVAEIYWREIRQNENIVPVSINKLCIKVALFIGLLLLITMLICIFLNGKISFSPSLPTPSPQVINLPSEAPIMRTAETADFSPVYVTSAGKKYHQANCKHIKNSKHIIGISVEEAENAGYTSCKDCIGE